MRTIVISFLAGTLFFGCKGSGNKSNGKNDDTPTSGHITVAVDESLKPIIDAEVAVFESTYPQAVISTVYTGESDAINLLLKDSVRMAIVSRKLTQQEDETIRSQSYVPSQAIIAYDGVSFILNTENTDTIFNLDTLSKILTGEFADWTVLNKASGRGKIQVVFDNAHSGAIKYLTDSLLNGKPLGKNCFAVDSNAQVIEYVKNNKNAIGIIGSAWISDSDDTLSQSFLKTIRVARILPFGDFREISNGLKPYQAYIATKQYPFWRNVVVISREARTGLGTGFTSFISGDRGQRIILKAGIVPATLPVRLVNVKPE